MAGPPPLAILLFFFFSLSFYLFKLLAISSSSIVITLFRPFRPSFLGPSPQPKNLEPGKVGGKGAERPWGPTRRRRLYTYTGGKVGRRRKRESE
ncbi:hypothetical protein LZ30DRAFT_700303 [Colletotrichum cereale]|nr:hypothetical protein LZ30DRAFT_700303 [Colletotrichum cereale]